MPNYKALVHYNFKKGMEAQGMKFLENELVHKAQQFGCHGIELLQNDKHPSSVVGVGTWNSLEEARKFQSLWEKKEKELIKFCVDAPTREFYKIRSTYSEKARKAA